MTLILSLDDESQMLDLLRLILSDRHTVVTEFSRKQYELEEAFVEIIKGNNQAYWKGM